MQTPVIGKCEDNRGVENASPHFYLLRHHIFLLQEFAFSDFYKLMVWGGFGQGVSAITPSTVVCFQVDYLSSLRISKASCIVFFTRCVFFSYCLR